MSSIINIPIQNGGSFSGIIVDGRGVFKREDISGTKTYAGECKDGYPCGLGVFTQSNGTKDYAEYGPDGKYDGRYLCRLDTYTDYSLFERGKVKTIAVVFADGRCTYNRKDCARNDPRVLALIARVAPVEVRPQPQPATRHCPPLALKRSSDGSAGSFLPLQALAAAVAIEVHPHAARRR